MNLNKYIQHCEGIISDEEGPDAKRCLLELEKYISANDISKINPGLFNDLRDLMIRLKIVAFANLADSESEEVLEKYFLNSFAIHVSLEDLLISKLFSVPYGARNEIREKFKQAILRNKQKLGNLTVGEWLTNFDKFSIPKTREESAIIRFIQNDNNLKYLRPEDIGILKKILHTYDYLLIYTLPATGEELKELKAYYLKNEVSRNSSPENNDVRLFSPQGKSTPGNKTLELNIREAMDKLTKIGEQIITSAAIKLANFDRPVRPSIKNWLYDYTSHLGQTGHSSMDRTNYLFRSENAINLSSPEKEKLSIILRSFDENTPIPIDAEGQEVVFEELLRKSASPTPQRPVSSQPASAPSLNFIHHVERQPVWQDSPANKSFTQPEKKPAPELFVKPYSRTKPPRKEGFNQNLSSPPIHKVRPFPSSGQAAGIPQGQTLSDPSRPSLPETHQSQTLNNSSKIDLPEIPQDHALGNSPSPNFNMTFTNPYPTPGTHEAKIDQKNDNIGNVSFSEGIPKTPVARVLTKKIPETRPASSASLAPKAVPPAQKSAPAPQMARPIYQRPQPNRNVIHPHLANEFPSGNPQPKIKGNIVDLKGD